MRTLKLTVTYDGTDYVGWQRQDNGRSIQAVLEDALGEIEGRPVTIVGAGRTDAGVHALGQVASVELTRDIEPPTLKRALNAKLPADIRLLDVVTVERAFHARYGARSKTYRYCLTTGAVAMPFARQYAWHVSHALDFGAMRAAGQVLCGRHDFSAFQTTGTKIDSPVRTIFTLKVEDWDGWWPWDTGDPTSQTLAVVEVVGDGFLRHMVRAIVGTLVEVGGGRRPIPDVTATLKSKRRDQAGPTAPAHGLFLVRVTYTNP